MINANVLLQIILNEFNEAVPKRDLQNYLEANSYAEKVGELLSRTLKRHITVDVLEDGRLSVDMAGTVIGGALSEDYKIVNTAVRKMQKLLNRKSGVGLNAVDVPINQDKILGLVKKISGSDFESVKWLLDEPVKLFTMGVVDDNAKANMEFQSKSGLEPHIVRTLSGGCCEWCEEIAGTYSYPCSDDVYRRHERCRCTVEFVSDKGKQDVWSKQWR